MDRLARFREVVAKAKAHPVYREKLRDVDPEKLTLKDLSSLPPTTTHPPSTKHPVTKKGRARQTDTLLGKHPPRGYFFC